MDWTDSDFRENVRYYGQTKSFSDPAQRSLLAVSNRWNVFCVAADELAFLPGDFQSYMEETAASGRKAEYGSKVFKACDPLPKLLESSENKSEVSSLSFSPYDDRLCVSTHSKSVNIWLMPDSFAGLKDVSEPSFTVDISGAVCQAWHRSCAEIVAIGGQNNVYLVNVSDGSLIGTACVDAGDSSVVTCLAFNQDGSVLRGCTDNGILFALDPREAMASPLTAETMHLGTVANCRPSQMECLTHLSPERDDVVLICGMTSFKEPHFAIYDLQLGKETDFVNPPWKKTYENKGAHPCFSYDWTTELMYFTLKGTAEIKVLHARDPTLVTTITLHKSASIIEAAYALPKHSIRKREVNRLVKLCRDRVQYCTHVCRTKLIYDSLPKSAPSGSLSVGDYLSGSNAAASPIGQLVASDFVEKKVRTTSIYLHTSGKEAGTSSDKYIDLKPASALLPISTNNLKVNKDYMCFPAKVTAGGALAVIERYSFGKVAQHEIRAHSEQITTFDISLLNESRLIVTGSSDCKVFLWRLPETVEEFRTFDCNDRSIKSPFEKIGSIQCEGKVTFVSFHPFVESVIITAERRYSESVVKLWDIRACVEAGGKADPLGSPVCICELNGLSKDGVSEVMFDSNGYYCAVSTLDNRVKVYVLDLQNGGSDSQMIVDFPPREIMRDIQVRFVNEDKHLLCVGFGEKSIRRCSLYDFQAYLSSDEKDEKSEDEMKDESSGPECISEVKFSTDNSVPMIYLDRDNSLLYVSFVGDRRIRVVEITDSSLDELMGQYTCRTDIIGFAVFPKKYVDVRTGEVAKMIRLGRTAADPVTFTVPRKRLEYFQNDLYPDTLDTEVPMYSSLEDYQKAYASGKQSLSSMSGLSWIQLKPEDMTSLSDAPPEEDTVHKKKRLAYEADAARRVSETAPTPEEAMEAFGRMAADAPGANRWDKVAVASEVAEDEWDD